jgi:hypothetical protein
MDIALIPPLSMMDYNVETHTTLLLPQLLMYRNYSGMAVRARNSENFVILDNGAAEGVEVSHSMLLSQAQTYLVNEVVCPDVLRSSFATLATTEKFMDYVANKYMLPGQRHNRHGDLKFGFVAQGTSTMESESFIWHMLKESKYHEFYQTVYLPRLLIGETRDFLARINVVRWMRNAHLECDIHLLGTHPAWVREVQAARSSGREIRSVDTSAPFNFALAGASVMNSNRSFNLPGPSREPGYFDMEATRFPEELTRDNVEAMKDWVR